MDISSPRRLIWIITTNEKDPPYPYITAEENTVLLKNNEGLAEQMWVMDKILFSDNDCSFEHDEIIDNFINGYNTGLLFLSVGNEVSTLLRRNKDMKFVLSKLEKSLGKDYSIEYIYISITDQYCYDIKRNKKYSNSEMLKVGIDSLMYKAKNMTEIWSTIKTGPKEPFILRIKSSYKLGAHFTIIDMKHPRFSHITPAIENSPNIYYSFAKLQNSVELIISPEFQGRVPTDGYVLTDIMSEFLCGLVKFNMITLINEFPKVHLEEVKKGLSFIENIGAINCIIIPKSQGTMNKTPTRSSQVYYLMKDYKSAKKAQSVYLEGLYRLTCMRTEDRVRKTKAELLSATMKNEIEKLNRKNQGAIDNHEGVINVGEIETQKKTLTNMYEKKTTDFKEKIELLQKELDEQKSNLDREINATRLERKTFRSFVHGLMKSYDNQ
ncbi:unnamed protein product [Rhizopus stolonifer]